MQRGAILLAVLALYACGKADNEPGPGGVTMGEARALDAAAAKVEGDPPPPVLPGPAAAPTASDQ